MKYLLSQIVSKNLSYESYITCPIFCTRFSEACKLGFVGRFFFKVIFHHVLIRAFVGERKCTSMEKKKKKDNSILGR